MSYIYPLLKTEISINHPEINFQSFLQMFLGLIANQSQSLVCVQILQEIKKKCHFMGGTEKAVNQIIGMKRKEPDLVTKKLEFSSIDSEDDSDKKTKVFQESAKTAKQFNEVEFFRKKKPKIGTKEVKENALRATKSMTTIEATPVRRKMDSNRKTPKSERRSASKVREDKTF